MSRATNNPASHRRRKKILKETKGFRESQGKHIRKASEKLRRAWQFAYRDRRVRRREMRSLWITRIGIASKELGVSYSRLINGLKKAQINLDRRILSELAMHQPQIFKEIVDRAR